MRSHTKYGLIAASISAATAVLASEDRVPVFLEVFINGRPTELIAEFEQDLSSGALFISRSEMEEVGLNTEGLPATVALDDVGGLRYDYREVEQEISVYVSDENLAPKVISAVRHDDHTPPDRATGVVLNYGLAVRASGDDNTKMDISDMSIGYDARAFSRFGTLFSSGTLQHDINRGLSRSIRLDTRYDIDHLGKALTFSFGDILTSAPAWGRSVRLGGIQIRKNFALRSDIITRNQLSFDGTAALASTVDVYVENNRVFSGSVEEGPFRLEDVPALSQSGEALVVIRDENGVEKISEVPFFTSENLVKPGTIDYSIDIGKPRFKYGSEDTYYGDNVLLASTLRYGLNDRITLHGHVEGGSDFGNLSLGLSSVAGNFAEYTVAAGASTHETGTSGFVYGSLATYALGIDVEASVMRSQSGYVDMASMTGMEMIAAQGNASAISAFPLAQDVIKLGVPVPWTDRKLNISYINLERPGAKEEIISAGMGFDFTDRGTLNVSGSHRFRTGDSQISAMFQMELGKRTYGRAGLSAGTNNKSIQAGLTRSMDDKVHSYGYDLNIGQEDDQLEVSGAAQYRHNYGTLQLRGRSQEGSNSLELSADGAIATTGGKFMISPKINDAFAIVDVGVKDIPILLQNHEVARSNRYGLALVPGLSSYRSNRISIDVDQLDMGTELAMTGADIVPARYNGIAVDFTGGYDVSEGQTATASFIIAGAPAPVGSEVILNNGNPIVIGYDGIAWITAIEAQNRFVISHAGGSCEGSFSYADNGELHQEIGPFSCN